MKDKRQYIILFIAFCVVLMLKYLYIHATANQLLILLAPVNVLVKFFTGLHSVYVPNEGYYFSQISMIINKSCSGLNFFVIAFLSFTFLFLKNAKTKFMQTSALLLAASTAYFLTIVSNSFRIFSLLQFEHFFQQNVWSNAFSVHKTIGVLTYVAFLLLSYQINQYLILNKRAL